MDIDELVKSVIEHEGLEKNQTPFRITDKSMSKWTSMFDDTIKLQLDPQAKKSKGRENFLYVKNSDDVPKGVKEQLRRYYDRDKNLTVSKALSIFDQSGVKGKLKYLKSKGINTEEKLENLFKKGAAVQEIKRQMR